MPREIDGVNGALYNQTQYHTQTHPASFVSQINTPRPVCEKNYFAFIEQGRRSLRNEEIKPKAGTRADFADDGCKGKGWEE
jgi:hypothetical protein